MIDLANLQFMRKLGVVKDGKKINRSHIIVGSDGKLLDIRIGVAPQESVDTATDFAKAHPANLKAAADVDD